MENHPQSIEQWLAYRLRQPCHRQLVIIEGQQQWGCLTAQKIIEKLESTDTLWFGSNGHEEKVRGLNQYRHYLGQEVEHLVINLYDGMRASALVGLSGIVKQSGLMILVCPSLQRWPEFNDPQKSQRISYGFEQPDSAYIRWFIDCFERAGGTALINSAGCQAQNMPLLSTTSTHRALSEQQQLVDKIVERAEHSTLSPLVITADRGRGKSAALGIAAGQLLRQGRQILLCASRFSQCDVLLRHARQQCPGSQSDRQTLSLGKGQLQFMPIDRLLAEQPQADMLLVDEAANLPVAQLNDLINVYPNTVLATTTQGYEGSGRGFLLRFLPGLQQQGAEHRRLTAPIRWQPDDPLEEFWDEALLIRTPALPECNCTGPLEIEVQAMANLLDKPEQLRHIFTLLRDAHYQTTPDDLVRILDNPDQQLVVARRNNALVGVVLLHLEGGTALAALASDIADGRRRVKGHLLAQHLAFHFNQSEAALWRYVRIGRIAVSDTQQRLGIGSQLLSYCHQLAIRWGCDFIGSTFALHGPLLAFWRQNGFQLIKLGQRKDTSSGQYSALVLTALTEQGAPHLEHWRQRYIASGNLSTLQLPPDTARLVDLSLHTR